MIAAIRSCLSAAGIDVAHEMEKTSLVLSSERPHLINDRFDVDQMMLMLEDASGHALIDGYDGLWATGDMTWELGPQKDFSKLLEYEWRLERFMQTHPALSGICQYHADTIPREVLRRGLLPHPSIFVNQTLSLINPHYLSAANDLELESTINRLSIGEPGI